ncbi:MAG: hypothetical protein ACLFPF_06990 [Halanaerobiales bacterium]
MLWIDDGEIVVPEFPYKGEIYFVDKNHSEGSDENGDGSFDSPWKTIRYGLQNISSGDALLVLGNNATSPVVYEERIESTDPRPLVPAGTPDRYTVIRAYPRRSVRMEGFFIRDASYVRIEGFQITNDLTGWDGSGIQIRSVDNDIKGISRLVGRGWDIGPYEYDG